MKKLNYLIILAFLCLLITYGCKKSSSSLMPMQAVVSGLTTKTALSLKITTGSPSGTVILNIVNQFGNTTYTTTSPVSPGDQLYMTYSTNIPDDPAGDGDGTIKFVYNGGQMGAVGGILSGSIHETVPQP